MIESIVGMRFENVEMHHVRLAFSRDMEEVGKFSFGKLLHLVSVVASIVYKRIRHSTTVLYYPPAGPDRVPMWRDFVVLLATRWLFPHTVFHFHAGGLSELYSRLSSFERFLFRASYFRPDVSIRLSELNPPDGEFLHARHDFVIPYGIDDHFAAIGPRGALRHTTPEILFVGVLRESKGILVLLEAASILQERGLDFSLTLVGRFVSREFEHSVRQKIADARLQQRVSLPGVLVGDEKWLAYARASIFCYPSFFEAETFGLAALEAMQFALPVVAARWRGVSSLVRERESGYLVPVGDSRALAERLEALIRHPDKASEMGKAGREIYLRYYTRERFRSNLERAFLSIAGG
jgi:glycosyltransferase involved in cell wall biosynthesis